MTICVPEPFLKLSDRQRLGRELLAGCREVSRQIGAEEVYVSSAAAVPL
jgi:hypothetical protein